jgi:hypothetical protein
MTLPTWGDEMPVRLRQRAAHASVAAALFAGLPLLAASAAWAAPVAAEPEAGAQVTFSGGGLLGLGLLVCTSEPDRGQLSVTPGATVVFVNHTGQQAMLRVDGHDAQAVGTSQAVPVVFHRGSVAVSMVPKCGLNLNQTFGSATIKVVVPSEASPSPRSGGTHSSGGSASDDTRGVPNQQTGDRAPTPAVGADGLPVDGGFAGDPNGLGDSSGVSNVGDPATAMKGNVAVERPITGPPGPAGANGLLALVATVCVAGVGAGAIRAILAQRASRPSVA